MAESMRAVLIKDNKGPVENLYIGEAAKPKPGAGQVLVKACCIFLDQAQQWLLIFGICILYI
jgi:hypothetical protein